MSRGQGPALRRVDQSKHRARLVDLNPGRYASALGEVSELFPYL